MSVPSWWDELLSVSPLLTAEDDELLTIGLAQLAHSFTEHADSLTRQQRQQVLNILERVLTTSSDRDRDAVATGFFEALLADSDEGFDLRSVWDDMGPESRAYCLAWNQFTGVESPKWMTTS